MTELPARRTPGAPVGDRRSDDWRRWIPDALGLAWVVAVGLALLVPAMLSGGSLGPYRELAGYGLLARPGGVGSYVSDSDLLSQMIPWTNLAWSQVHQGHLPLWNPYSVLGTPLAFNWQSSTFSLPALVGYLAPQRLAYTVQLVVTLVVGGTGAYVLCRVMRLTVVASTLAAVVFECCGPFFGWLGWPVAGVLSWTGWLFAAAVLVVRGSHRLASIVLFSVVLALAVMAGQPDTLLLLLLFLAVFMVATIVTSSRFGPAGVGWLRAVADLAVASIAGLMLSAPLLLPGLQLLARSSRLSNAAALAGEAAEQPARMTFALMPGVNGLPIEWNRIAIGVLAPVLAIVGIAFHRRKPAVVGLIAVAASAVLISFTPAVISALTSVPGLGGIRFPRAFAFVEFAVAILAGVGLSRITTSTGRSPVLRVAAIAFVGGAVVSLIVWTTAPSVSVFGEVAETYYDETLVWALGAMAVGLVSVVLLRRSPDRGLPAHRETAGTSNRAVRLRHLGRWAGLSILVFESAFLFVLDSGSWPSTSTPFPSTPASVALRHAVGSSLVALGSDRCFPPGLGIPPNDNIDYQVHELWAYDPMLPKALYSSWTAATGEEAGNQSVSTYCPVVLSVTLARRYGVGFILEPRGTAGPPGTVFDRSVGDESLFSVPGSARATVTPLTTTGGLPAVDAPGTAVSIHQPQAGRWVLHVSASTPQVLRLRLTASPGWTATIDGRPLALSTYSGVMLQARIPPGHHVVRVVYWPKTFTLGLILAFVAALGLMIAVVVALVRRRRPDRSAQGEEIREPPRPVAADEALLPEAEGSPRTTAEETRRTSPLPSAGR